MPSQEEVPVFRSEETRAHLTALYDEALRRWQVPYESIFVEDALRGDARHRSG